MDGGGTYDNLIRLPAKHKPPPPFALPTQACGLKKRKRPTHLFEFLNTECQFHREEGPVVHLGVVPQPTDPTAVHGTYLVRIHPLRVYLATHSPRRPSCRRQLTLPTFRWPPPPSVMHHRCGRVRYLVIGPREGCALPFLPNTGGALALCTSASILSFLAAGPQWNDQGKENRKR